jgi:putative ABC transport system permease protein
MNIFVLGFRSLWRQPTMLWFAAAGLTAVLAPLLLLYGFKFGVITALLSALREQPANREIVLSGNYVLQPQDIERLRALPEVAFVVPATRTIAARVELVRPGPNGVAVGSGLTPSGPGDPVLPAGAVLERGQIALSASLAQRLGVGRGDRVEARNQRVSDSGRDTFSLDLTVAYVVDRQLVPGDKAYVPTAVLFELEAFLDGYEVPSLGLPGMPLAKRVERAENVRLYARSIEDVPELDRRLSASNYLVYSKAAEVAGILGLNRSLDTMFTLIAAIGSIGYGVSLAANLLGSILQQRKLLSLIRLMGGSRRGLMLFPLAQGATICALGVALASLLFFLVAAVANARFADYLPPGVPVCRLDAVHFLAALLATAAIVAGVVAAVARVVLAVSPGEVLYES